MRKFENTQDDQIYFPASCTKQNFKGPDNLPSVKRKQGRMVRSVKYKDRDTSISLNPAIDRIYSDIPILKIKHILYLQLFMYYEVTVR